MLLIWRSPASEGRSAHRARFLSFPDRRLLVHGCTVDTSAACIWAHLKYCTQYVLLCRISGAHLPAAHPQADIWVLRITIPAIMGTAFIPTPRSRGTTSYRGGETHSIKRSHTSVSVHPRERRQQLLRQQRRTPAGIRTGNPAKGLSHGLLNAHR
jgi:hypothetical protein